MIELNKGEIMKTNSKVGFTLMELIISILIIGVLSAIALPTYIKAREKAKAAEAFTVLNAVASAEQRWALTHNNYSSDLEGLDISLEKSAQVEDDVIKTKYFEISVNEGKKGYKDTAYVIANRKKEGSETVLYSLYRCIDDSKALCLDVDKTDRITCETLGFGGEANAMDPCGGAPVNDAAGCSSIGGYWLTASGTCYASAQERCEVANGSLDNNICKFVDTDLSHQYEILDDGMACYSGINYNSNIGDASASCRGSTINEGGVCYSNHVGGCQESIINNGGLCVAVSNTYGCSSPTINDGGICRSDKENGCFRPTINNGGICDGISQNSCFYPTINEGGVCLGKNTNYAGYTCKEGTLNKGGICIGLGNPACRAMTVNDGGIVIANDSTTGYGNTYKGSGCCVDCAGSGYCHDSGHVCQLDSDKEKEYCDMYKKYQ